MTIFKILGTLSHSCKYAAVGFRITVLPRRGTKPDLQPAFPRSERDSISTEVTSNLVVVRVVVRDGDGKPVEGLRKEDFKLFDRGKEQAITQFDVVSTIVPPTNSPAA